MSLLVGVDLGKTGCRVQVLEDGRLHPPVAGPGARGLAEPGGAEDALATVLATIARALPGDPGAVDQVVVGQVVVGAAGAEAAPAAAAHLAAGLTAGLATGLPAGLAVRFATSAVGIASDSLTAHVGALAGRPGVVLAAGTGAVALGVGVDGQVRQVDGRGQWLGDDGGGAWIGREALRAALAALEGRRDPTALTEAAERHFGDLDRLPATLAAGGNIARRTAGFVPEVVRCADDGDAQAADVLRRAAHALADTTVTAARATQVRQVAAVGGLTAVPRVMEAWRVALPEDLEVVPARGGALDGALTLAGRSDLPHESRVLRYHSGSATGGLREGAVDVDALATEQVRPDLTDLDERSPEDLVDLMLAAESVVPARVAEARAGLAAAVRLVEDAFASGGRLIYVGAGTPGRLAALDAAECPPTFGTLPGQVVAVLAGGDQAAAAAVEGAEDDAEAGARDLNSLGPSEVDVVVGISASGRTPYVLAALEAARAAGARTVAVVNNPRSPAAARSDVAVELLTGAEVLAGSTRLKAGSAQKLALNILSTSAMIRSGRTYCAWMVDVVASNEKLRRRARRIVREATGVDDAEAVRVLELSDWHTKTALVSLLVGEEPESARSRLADAGGRVRRAVDGRES